MEKQIVVEPISTEVAVRAQQEAPAMLKKAEAIVILNQSQYESANDVMKVVKTKYKELDTKRKEITKPLDQAKNAVMDLFRQPLELLKQAEATIKKLMIDYADEQDRLRREEQRKLEAKARAEEDRKRKELEERAKKWAAKGNTLKAEELKEQSKDVHIEAPVIAAKVDKVRGVSYSMTYSVDTADINQVPREYLLINFPALNKRAQASKGMAKVTGVTFKCTKKLASRGY